MRAASPSPSPRRSCETSTALPRLRAFSSSARPRPHLQSYLLALRAILHADAPAFGFHSGVEPRPILLWEVEIAQLYIHHLDAVVPKRHGAASLRDLSDNCIGSIGRTIHRDERAQRTAPDARSQLRKEDVTEP